MDPFLHLHKVAPGMFEFSGLRTTNIRDQILRSYLAVKRCAKVGLIGSRRPLLVLGGGAAGVTAAMAAAELGIEVTLYEQKSTPFSRQATCDRHLDPVEYDWPAMHWDTGKFPWSVIQNGLPLPFTTNSASHLAMQWSATFLQWCRHSPNGHLLTLRLGTHVSPNNVQFSVPTNCVVLLDPYTNIPTPFGAALSCVGFATERVHASNPTIPATGEYQGFQFWSWDPYDLRGLNLAISWTPEVLISGGGDGALQDFIRLLTGRSAKSLYNCLLASIHVNHNACMAADEAAHRAYPWLDAPKHDAHFILSEWHQHYITEAEIIYQSLDSQNPDWYRDLKCRDFHMTLVHACDHFDSCYGLNRLLVLVLAMGHARHTGRQWRQVLTANTGIGSVTSASIPPHTCGNPAICHGFRHDVAYKSLQCPKQVGSTIPSALPNVADVVILRHGLTPSPSFGQAPMPNQTVPYWLDS